METKQENVIATDYADVMQKSYHRLCHERYHFQGTSGCPRWPEAGTAKNPV